MCDVVYAYLPLFFLGKVLLCVTPFLLVQERLGIICSHLPAYGATMGAYVDTSKDGTSMRDEALRDATERLRFAKDVAVDDMSNVVWMGDLNYRGVVLDAATVEGMREQWREKHVSDVSKEIREGDMLFRGMMCSKGDRCILQGFQEPDITFPPTYRLNIREKPPRNVSPLLALVFLSFV